jgi:hypothetical protein
MSANRLGAWSAFAVFLIGLVYMGALAIGFAVYGLSAPIVDPVLAIMEILTLVSAPLLLVMMAAVHRYAPTTRKPCSLIALAFMILFVGMTSAWPVNQRRALRRGCARACRR